MAEAVDVFKDRILNALDDLVAKKRPPKPGGDMYIARLRNRILTESSITLSEIIDCLASAGYGLDDIMLFLQLIGIVSSAEDWVKVREAVRRILLSSRGEEE